MLCAYLPGGLTNGCLLDSSIAIGAAKIPTGPGWVHEIKYDGYRMQVRKAGNRVRLWTRRGFDWTNRYPRIVAAAMRIKSDFTMDGECVCVGPDGIANFDRLHSRCRDWEAIFYAFDLMEHAGEDLRRLPLGDRKETLRAVLRRPSDIYLCRHDDGDGEARRSPRPAE